jgi:hypothetical protein
MRKGSKPCRLRPVGRMAGVRSRSPPGCRAHEAAVQRAHQAGHLVVLRQQPVRFGQLFQRARRGVGRRPRAQQQPARRWPATSASTVARSRPLAVRGLGQRQQQVHALRGGRLPTTCRPCGISVYSSSSTCSASARCGPRLRRPRRARPLRSSSAAAWAWISAPVRALGSASGSRRASARARLQVDQALVQAGLRHRRRQVADQRGGRPALGDGAFAGVVGWRRGRSSAGRRSGGRASSWPVMPFCLPGMNSSAPWVPKCSTAWAPKSSRSQR